MSLLQKVKTKARGLRGQLERERKRREEISRESQDLFEKAKKLLLELEDHGNIHIEQPIPSVWALEMVQLVAPRDFKTQVGYRAIGCTDWRLIGKLTAMPDHVNLVFYTYDGWYRGTCNTHELKLLEDFIMSYMPYYFLSRPEVDELRTRGVHIS